MGKAKKRLPGDPGRKPGSPNTATGNQRDHTLTATRVSAGFMKTLEHLVELDTTGKTSRADILHEALQLYAFKKVADPAALHWVNKI
jgi:hypothetical protein